MARQGKKKCNTGYIPVNQVEEAFIKQLRKIRFNPDGFKLRQDNAGNLQTSSALRAEIRQLDTSISNLTTALTQAMDSPASAYIIKQIGDLDSQKKKLEANLRRAEIQEAATKSLVETEAEIYESICYLLDNFDSLEYTGKNELIRKLIKTCILEDENLRIVF